MGNCVSRLRKKMKAMAVSEKGQGLVEYALILVLIAVVVIAAMQTLGKNTSNVISRVGSAISQP